MKRVASAVRDGSTAIRLVHDYLALAPPGTKVNEYRLQARRTVRHVLRNARSHWHGERTPLETRDSRTAFEDPLHVFKRRRLPRRPRLCLEVWPDNRAAL